MQNDQPSRPTIVISNDAGTLYKDIKEALLIPLTEAVDRISRELSFGLVGHQNEALLQDLLTQSEAAREFNLSQQRISQLVSEGKIRAYTSKRLVRRSEVR